MEHSDSKMRREPLPILLKQSKLRELKRMQDARLTIQTSKSPIERRVAQLDITEAQERLDELKRCIAKVEG